MNWTEKYRPVTFDDFWQRNCPALRFVRESIRANQLPSLCNVVGVFGSGKTTLARAVGRRLNCCNAGSHPFNPCGKCAGCAEITPYSSNTIVHNGYMEYDVTGHTPDHIIASIREHVQCHKFNRSDSPQMSPNWVVCLDEIARVKTAIQEKMIKLVENAYETNFVFCFSDPSKIIPPIRERGANIELLLPSTSECVAPLIRIAREEGYTIDERVASFVAESVRNIPRRCLQLLQRAAILSPAETIDLNAVRAALSVMAR